MSVDVTALAPSALGEGDHVELIGPSQTLETVAELAETIPYEILTSLGRRYARTYLDQTEAARQGAAMEVEA